MGKLKSWEYRKAQRPDSLDLIKTLEGSSPDDPLTVPEKIEDLDKELDERINALYAVINEIRERLPECGDDPITELTYATAAIPTQNELGSLILATKRPGTEGNAMSVIIEGLPDAVGVTAWVDGPIIYITTPADKETGLITALASEIIDALLVPPFDGLVDCSLDGLDDVVVAGSYNFAGGTDITAAPAGKIIINAQKLWLAADECTASVSNWVSLDIS